MPNFDNFSRFGVHLVRTQKSLNICPFFLFLHKEQIEVT